MNFSTRVCDNESAVERVFEDDEHAFGSMFATVNVLLNRCLWYRM